jgi:hypothetical protein
VAGAQGTVLAHTKCAACRRNHRQCHGFFPESRLVRISLPESGFARMLWFIRDTFWLGDEGRAIPVVAGLYGEAKFYRARGKFYFPKTCNYWTVSAVREAGLPVIPLFAVTARGVLAQVERHGDVIQK